MKIIILGAGISGISAGYHLALKGKEALIFEQNNSWGGLCDNFEINGFRFDYSIHLSFTRSKYVEKLFSESCEFYTYTPLISSYYYGYWLKYPAQNNLYPLDIEEKIKIIKGFIMKNKNNKRIESYERWLRSQYGDYFAENFPMKYTRKYWTVEAREIKTEWIGNRMYKPTIEEVLRGAMSDNTPNTYYADEVRYPKFGGYKSFLNHMAEKCKIYLNKKVILIDIKNKKIEFEDGTSEYYDCLISSFPLPEIVRMIKDVPKTVYEASEKLSWTSVALVSLGFKRPDIARYLWFYIYDEDILPARAYSPNLKSLDNVPNGCSSLQFEVYFSKYKPLKIKGESLIDDIVRKFSNIGLFDINDIVVSDYREIKYGNVIFDREIYKNRKIIHEYLDNIGIKYIGRFGKWDYLWSDQSLMTGKNIKI